MVFGIDMRHILIILSLLWCAIGYAQINPSYQQFNTNHFITNGSPWKIELRNTNFTVSVSGIPSLEYEIWYDNFSGFPSTPVSGWVSGSFAGGGGSVNYSNAAGHWGTIAVSVTSAINSGHSLARSSVISAKPPIPGLLSTTGWTNRIIWRMNDTNSVAATMVLQADGAQVGALGVVSMVRHGIGILINTTNSNQIMGCCSSNSTGAGGTISRTNLGTIVSGQWYTNYIWSATAGVISFSLNNGAEATLSTSVPDSALTPAFLVWKSATTSASHLEVDEWLMYFRRP